MLDRMVLKDSEYEDMESSFPMLLNEVLSSKFTDLMHLFDLCKESYLLVSLSKNRENESGDADARLVKISDFMDGKVTLGDIAKWRDEHESKQKDTD